MNALGRASSRRLTAGAVGRVRYFAGIAHDDVRVRPGEPPLPPSLVEQYNLTDPTRWVPLSLAFFGVTSATGIYHWNEESQILGLFALFVGTVYVKGGDAIGKYFDDSRDETFAKIRALESVGIDEHKAVLESHKLNLTKVEDLESLKAARAALFVQGDVATKHMYEHHFVEHVKETLDRLVDDERKFSENLEKSMVSDALESVRSGFAPGKGGEHNRKKALDAAIKTLENPSQKIARKEDPVLSLIETSLASSKKKIDGMRGKDVPLTQEQKEAYIKEVTMAKSYDGESDAMTAEARLDKIAAAVGKDAAKALDLLRRPATPPKTQNYDHLL